MFMRVRADRRSGLLPEVAGRNCGSTRQVVLLVTAVGDCKVVSLSRDGKSNSEQARSGNVTFGGRRSGVKGVSQIFPNAR